MTHALPYVDSFFWLIPISLVAAELTTSMTVARRCYAVSAQATARFLGLPRGLVETGRSFIIVQRLPDFSGYITAYFPDLSG